MTYRPAPVPSPLAQLPRFLDREFRQIKQALDAEAARIPQRVLLAESLISQDPTAVGVPGAIFLTFGAAQGGPSDPVQIAADGMVTFNQGGTYSIDTRYIFYRSTNPGRARLVLRGLINGVQSGNPIIVIMDDPSFSAYEQYTIAGVIPAGTTLRWQLARDVGFENDGGVVSVATALGWGTTPSALMRILKF